MVPVGAPSFNAYRSLTISRQFGSGGAAIARRIAERRGWTLLDARIIMEVAHQAGVDVGTAREKDERVDFWFHQFNKGGFQAAAAGVMLGPNESFNAEAMAALSQGVVERAYAEGNCVIVGRGAQCILDGHPNVFCVFIYGSERERLQRIRNRVPPGMDPELLLESVNDQRARYIKRFFRRNWAGFSLYEMMISSDCGEQGVVSTIECAMSGADGR